MIVKDWGHDGLNELQQGINRMLFELKDLQEMMERLEASMKQCKHVSDGKKWRRFMINDEEPWLLCKKCSRHYR